MTDLSATPGRFAILANPTRFLQLSGALQPWLYGLAATALIVGLEIGRASCRERVCQYV